MVPEERSVFLSKGVEVQSVFRKENVIMPRHDVVTSSHMKLPKEGQRYQVAYIAPSWYVWTCIHHQYIAYRSSLQNEVTPEPSV